MKRGFTLVELLTVLAVISILVGILLPSLGMVRRIARETKQKAQFTAIGVGLEAFRKDYGQYPRSEGAFYTPGGKWDGPKPYGGSQKLCEAMLGFDLQGFHPLTLWEDVGALSNGLFYADDLDNRRGPYIVDSGDMAYKIGDLFSIPDKLAPDTFVLCDAFKYNRIDLILPDGRKKAVKAGSPILYYRANPSSKTIRDVSTRNRMYDWRDNDALITAKTFSEGTEQPWRIGVDAFYDYIADPRIPPRQTKSGLQICWPFRPDSYLLISAGVDGIYDTPDDIRNFGL